MSNNTNDDFRQKLKNFAEDVQEKASHCTNEEATKQSLVLPFFELLGYDTRDPREFAPEYIADPSGKKKVDYVILRNEKPIIALECKANHCSHKDFVAGRGQLQAYFQSEVTIKMGILTDGVIYEFYADSDHLNMMDLEAFWTLDLNDIVQGQQIEESVLERFQSFQKSTFNPEELRAEAKKMRSLQNFVKQIEELFQNPSEDFVRLLVQKQALTQQTPTEEDKKLVKKAFDVFLKERCKSLGSEDSEEDEENPNSVEEGELLRGVLVNGRFFSSVRVAFRENGLPDNEHQKFRKELKKEGSSVYEKANGEKFHFETIEAHELKKLVSQEFCSIGTVVFDKERRYQAKITNRGTLQTLDEQKEGVPSSLAAELLNKNNHNGWSNFWHVNYEGREIPLSELRAIAAESLKKI
ncbi:MAG: type I restriction enzyme HsdR N-terminal domain-containing protein [Acetobacter sp.]|nr:type I restriction enzyme HsdR N-terminal domain-containing protein [Acetobacter sp.]